MEEEGDAPSRGHDLKLAARQPLLKLRDAPSRGHDLKLSPFPRRRPLDDAPSRGHDLKLLRSPMFLLSEQMPPHGGMT